MMTRDEINDRKLAALHCDDYTQYCREMREIARLERELGIRRATVQVRNKPSQRYATGRRKAFSVGHAIAMMEGRA